MTVRKFEAVKYALRQSKDGVVVSLVIHPSDVDNELMSLPIGSRIAVGWVAIADDETPVERTSSEPIKITTMKERKRFAELPASQQAAMLCSDARFQKFLELEHRNMFPDWFVVGNPADCAAHIVRKLCGVKSRADIPSNPAALERWQTLESRYQTRLLENTYADQIR